LKHFVCDRSNFILDALLNFEPVKRFKTRCRLKSPVMRNSWGVLVAREIKVLSSLRKREKGVDLRILVVAGGGR